MPNVNYSWRTAPLTSKVAFYIFIQQILGTEYFKHGIYSPFFFSSKCGLFHNSNVFGSCIIHILYTGCAKIKKNNSGAKRLSNNKNVQADTEDTWQGTMPLKQVGEFAFKKTGLVFKF